MTATGPLAVRERAQRDALAASVAAGRETVAVVVDPDARLPAVEAAAASLRCVPVDAFLAQDVDPSVGAVVAIDGPGSATVQDLAAAMDAWCEAGASVLVASPDLEDADRLRRAWPDGRHLHQRLEERSVVADAADGVPGGAIRWGIALRGADDASVDVPDVAGTGVNARHHAALQAANERLEAANARLRQNAASKESASAASLQTRIAGLQRQLDDAIAAAKQNDDLFQDARRGLNARAAELARPEHRAVAGVRRRVRALPGARLGFRVLRRVRRALA